MLYMSFLKKFKTYTKKKKKKLLEVPGIEPVSTLPKITIKDHDNHPPR